ncbi:ATP-binding protein [Methylocystis sp. 9N]|uniref:ATP-binding protein n=1 Tax=Methylocystis borbori TaxID=3118750 RepID=A0ABU7XET7_9HYPH
MSIKVNIENQVRQTTVLAWRPLLPLFEAVMNSFQAIKEANLPFDIPGRVTIEVARRPDMLNIDTPPISGFRITDNGIGLDDDNWDSFNTAFSPHKLNRGGKGLGRFTWLKAFDLAKVQSTFKDKGGFHTRSFTFDVNYDSDDERGLPKTAIQGHTGTTVELVALKPQYADQCPRQTEQFIQKLVEHFILVFLEKDCPSLTLIDLGQKHDLNTIFEKDFKAAASAHTFLINDHEFTLHGFRLPSSRATKHKLVYAADQRSVLSDKLADHVPNLAGRLIDDEGKSFFYLGIVQSLYLSEHVNTNRTDFEFGNPDDAELELPLPGHDQLIPKADIRSKALAFVQDDLANVIESINSAKLDAIRRYVHRDAPQYRILLKHPERFLDKLTPMPQRQEIETALHRELFLRETELKKESTRIIKEAGKISDYQQYHKQFTKFLDEYNELGVSALAQYVAHRRIILDFLERAINLPPDKKNFPIEKVVHDLVFPMQFTNEDIPSSEQNLWIIDERLTYHSFVSSDKKNKVIPVIDCNDQQRGDIVALDEHSMIFDEKVIFSDENRKGHPLNSIVVIEFKQPGRTAYKETENPVLQATRVINAIRAGKYKHKGRKIPIANAEIPATIFVIADLTDRLKNILVDFGATITPDKQGFYGYHSNHRVYYEVVDYTKMLADAIKRNQRFFDKLNLVDSH